MRLSSFNQVIELVKKGQPASVAVAFAHEKHVLETIKQALQLNMIEPHLIGNTDLIKEIADKIGLNLESIAIYQAETEEEAAYLAAKMANEGQVKFIMKGFLNSAPFLKGVLHKDFQLKTGKLLSHLSIFEIPNQNRLIYMSDGGINIDPNMEQKEQILKNAADFLLSIGIVEPRMAILSANELVNEKMKVTIDAQKLAKQGKEGGFGKVKIEGPLPLDLAISKESLKTKGLKSEIDGEADFFLVPTIEAGNILGKSITYFANGKMAGIVLGAKIPLILNSRSDSIEAKLASIALAVLAVQE